MKIGKYSGKRSNWGNFPRSPNFFSETGGKSETGGMHHCLKGDGRPCIGVARNRFLQSERLKLAMKTAMRVNGPVALLEPESRIL